MAARTIGTSNNEVIDDLDSCPYGLYSALDLYLYLEIAQAETCGDDAALPLCLCVSCVGSITVMVVRKLSRHLLKGLSKSILWAVTQ
jgi:hypothetical protein